MKTKKSILVLFSLFFFINYCDEPTTVEEKDTESPTISFESLKDGDTVTNIIVIEVSTEDDKGISNVEFYIDEIMVLSDTSAPYQYEWDTKIHKNGEVVVYAKSYDLSGNSSKSESLALQVFNGKLAYLDRRGGRLIIMDVDGSKQTILSDDGGITNALPQFSIDGNTILYTNNSNIHLTDIDGNNQINLSNCETCTDMRGRFSPDEQKITFYSFRENGGFYDIFLMDVDGNNITRLSSSPENTHSYNPRFSLDGQKVVYLSLYGGRHDIHTVNIDGTNQSSLTDSSEKGGVHFDFSPDGRQIVFSDGKDILLMDINGDNVIALTNSEGTYFSNLPRFSPDGKKIAFKYGNSESTGSDIFIMDADGSNLTNLTNDDATLHSGHSFHSNSKKIVYHKNSQIYIMDNDGSNVLQLTNDDGDNQTPVFQPEQ